MSSSIPTPLEDGQLRIRLFDGLQVCGRRQSLSRFRTQKTAALLAYLALQRGRSIARDQLLELLWPDGDPETGRRSLNTALWSLRQSLEIVGGSVHPFVRSDRSFVELDAARVTTDVAEFTGLLTAALRTLEPAGRIRLLEEAVGLYQGELLRGYYEDWVFPEQTRLAAEHRRAARELVVLLEAEDPVRAVPYACLLAREEPECEEHRLRLMHLYTQAGDPAAALREYTDHCRVLRQERGGQPGTRIRDLARQISARGSEPPQRGPGERHVAPLPPPAMSRPPSPEPVGGAISPEARLYVRRPADAAVQAALARGEAVVLVRGSRQCGKSSLLARVAREAREQGCRVAVTDIAAFGPGRLCAVEPLFRALSESLADQLGQLAGLSRHWDPDLGAVMRFRGFMRRVVLAPGEGDLVWILDGVDDLFGQEGSDELFALLRSWYNERAMEPDSPWQRLTQVLAYATEAHLFIRDLNQSPFNVGARVELEDFTLEQLEDLNLRMGSPLPDAGALGRFAALTGGHPYLVRRGLQSLAQDGVRLRDLEEAGDAGTRVFSGHLEALLRSLRRDADLCAALVRLLEGGGRLEPGEFYRLRGAGLLRGAGPGSAAFRCELYRRFFAACLGPTRS